MIEVEELKLDREIDVSLCIKPSQVLRRRPKAQARRRGSWRDLARVTELMSRIENGQQVRQEYLDYFGINLCPGLAHLVVPIASTDQGALESSCRGEGRC